MPETREEGHTHTRTHARTHAHTHTHRERERVLLGDSGEEREGTMFRERLGKGGGGRILFCERRGKE